MQDRIRITRRAVIAGSAALAASGQAFGQTAPAKPARIVVNASGGAQAAALRKAFYEAYEQKFGIRVVDSSPPDLGKLKAMVTTGSSVDSVDASAAPRILMPIKNPTIAMTVEKTAMATMARHPAADCGNAGSPIATITPNTAAADSITTAAEPKGSSFFKIRLPTKI